MYNMFINLNYDFITECTFTEYLSWEQKFCRFGPLKKITNSFKEVSMKYKEI